MWTLVFDFLERVKFWITFNEAWSATKLASGSGKAPSIKPFMDLLKDPYIAGHNILNAHAAAVDIYRQKYQHKQKGMVGITNNLDWREPKTDTEEDIAAAERAVLFQLGWFSEPIFGNGDYPTEMRAILGDVLPSFTDEEKRLLKGSADFFGLNNYGTGWVSASKVLNGTTPMLQLAMKALFMVSLFGYMELGGVCGNC